MKITKKIFTTFLAMLMVVLMLPVSARAEGNFSYTITGKGGTSFRFIKLRISI